MATLSARAIRVRTAEGWQDIAVQGAQGVQGPPGPQGAAGVAGTTGPQGPAGPGGLIAVQRHRGVSGGYVNHDASGQYVRVDATNPLRIDYTPTVPVWWDVNYQIGLIQKLDAAYHYAFTILRLAPADADGVTDSVELYEMQHVSVQTFAFRSGAHLYRLNAGIAYTCRVWWATSGGSWQIAATASAMALEGRVFPR